MIEIYSVRCGCLSLPELIIRPGLIAITGPNGSGKTTLLEMITGILTPALGTVLINGKGPGEVTVGWICEFPDLNMTFTRVIDEISSPLRFAYRPCREVLKSAQEIAEICGLVPLLDRPVRTLSGGEKVLVALAAALINRPDILILDETDSHLDSATLKDTDALISRFCVPLVLFATHRPERVAQADFVIVLKEGQVVRKGTPDEVFKGYQDLPVKTSSLRPLRNPALWRAVYAADS
ncbi:MAG: ABC transporter ATP-binding protein [Methanobacteriota archaeon]